MKIRVTNVVTVKGAKLKEGWDSDMVVITTADGHRFIDNLPNQKHSNRTKAWYGYDNWNNLRGSEVNIVVTDDWGNMQNRLSNEAQYNIWAKHPNARMVR